MTENVKLTDQSAAAANMIGTEAELIFTIAGQAPDVILSFDGVHLPTQLLGELTQIGWGTPLIPPPPGSAIEWTPDPTTGHEYTIRSWKVAEYRLERSATWTPQIEANVGAATIEVLRRHQVNIIGLRGALAEQAAAPVAPAATPTAAGAQPATAPTSPAGTLAIALTAEDTDAPAGLTQWTAKSGRQRAPWTWSEGAGISEADSARLKTAEAHVWFVESDTRPASSDGKDLIQLICLETKGADKQVTKLGKLFGETPSVVELQSLVGGTNALLISSAVPAHAREMICSNLLLRFPKMIVRD